MEAVIITFAVIGMISIASAVIVTLAFLWWDYKENEHDKRNKR